MIVTIWLKTNNIINKFIKGIFDINKDKFNRYTPQSKIKIINEKKLKSLKIDYILLLIWHFKTYVTNKIKRTNKKIKIIVPFPKIKIM